MTTIRGFSRKNKSKISYPVCKSAIKPVAHSPDLPLPQPPTEKEDSLSVNARESTGTKSLCPLMHVRVPVPVLKFHSVVVMLPVKIGDW